MRKHTVKDVLTYIKSLPIGSRVYLVVPLHIPEGRSLAAHLEIQLQQGYSRLWTEDGIVAIEDALLWKDDRAEGLYLLIDRLALSEELEAVDRLGESVETAFFEGRGYLLAGYRGDEGWRASACTLTGVQQYLRGRRARLPRAQPRDVQLQQSYRRLSRV